MKEKLDKIVSDALEQINTSEKLDKLNDIKTAFLGKKGELTAVLKGMKDVAPEDRPKVGQMVNDARQKIEEVLDEKRRKLDSIEHREEREAELRRDLAAADAEVRKIGADLGAKRREVAARLAGRVTRNLHGLGFLSASFGIKIEECEPAEHGCDSVTYMFGPNPGEQPRPLADIASSGEIARVMLALKSVLAAHDRTEVIVFDESDANRGGERGRAVGERLREVARRRQVIAITHLPQSAAYGDRHFMVSKSVSGGRTRTTIAEVAGDRRVNEIARMLGGERPTGVVKNHAEELLRISSSHGV